MPLNTANYHLGSVGRTYATVAREGGMPNISVSAELFGNLKHKGNDYYPMQYNYIYVAIDTT